MLSIPWYSRAVTERIDRIRHVCFAFYADIIGILYDQIVNTCLLLSKICCLTLKHIFRAKILLIGYYGLQGEGQWSFYKLIYITYVLY